MKNRNRRSEAFRTEAEAINFAKVTENSRVNQGAVITGTDFSGNAIRENWFFVIFGKNVRHPQFNIVK